MANDHFLFDDDKKINNSYSHNNHRVNGQAEITQLYISDKKQLK